MTRRRLIKALVGLPFVGGLLRQRLDVVDVVKGMAPTPVVFSVHDICRLDEFTATAKGIKYPSGKSNE